MKNSTINILLVVMLVVLSIIALFILLKSKKSAVTTEMLIGDGNNVFPLKLGSGFPDMKTGYTDPLIEVKQLQSYLNIQMDLDDKANNRRYITAPERLAVDGKFGSKTLAQVQRFLSRDDVPKDLFYSKNMDKY